jgi:hypothetical protein
MPTPMLHLMIDTERTRTPVKSGERTTQDDQLTNCEVRKPVHAAIFDADVELTGIPRQQFLDAIDRMVRDMRQHMS